MNPAITQLRETAEARATEPHAWKALAEALLVALRASEKPSSALVFETIDALRKILDLQPEDPFALLNMADISLNQQVFEKAVEYYARYLAVQPSDALSRARYASALAFTGESEQAILELEGILKDQPENFHALAYLAVTHAQAGSIDKAREVGTRALQVAPSDEARERFNGFLASLGSSASAPPEVRGSGGPQVQNLRGGAGSDSSVNAVAEHVRNNEVAGQKFSHAELRGDTLVLVFRQFPMDKMPPFIRDKFSQGIVDAARSAGVSASRVSFVDEDGQKEMHAVPLAD
jgi:tetratricopeptide (TPR) repeat protein